MTVLNRSQMAFIDHKWRRWPLGFEVKKFRSAVAQQVRVWKKENEHRAKCVKCSRRDREFLHCDHVDPFAKLLIRFMEEKGIPKDIMARPNTQAYRFLADGGAIHWRKDWQVFHKKHAKLRWMCFRCHFFLGRGDDIPAS